MKKNLSQLKRHRQSLKLRDRNRALRSTMRTSIKGAREAIATEDAGDETRTRVASATRVIDRMVARNLIHRNTAARYKSRLTRHFNKLTSPKARPAQAMDTPPVGTPATEDTAV